MRIEMRDRERRRVGQILLESGQHPTRARTADSDREVFLDWERAVDDAGQIRRCLSCGCEDLFHEKAFPQVTGVVVVLAFIGAAAGLLGLAQNLPVLIAMSVVLVLDLAILIFSKTRLVCYRCRTSYHELPIARYHRSWDRGTAEKYPPPIVEPAEPGGGAPPAPPARPGDDALSETPTSRIKQESKETMLP